MNLGGFLKAQGKTNEAFECYHTATGQFPAEMEGLAAPGRRRDGHGAAR